MAVGVVMNFPDATLEQYDQVLSKTRETPAGAAPPGGLFHWAAKNNGGLLIIDVWQTKEQFDSFLEDTLGPAAFEIGVPSFPDITFYEVHNYLAAQESSEGSEA
jgi:hypothetical protein